MGAKRWSTVICVLTILLTALFHAAASGSPARSRIAAARVASQARRGSRSSGVSVSQMLRSSSSRRVGNGPRVKADLEIPQKSDSSVCEPFQQRELPMFRVPRMKCRRFADWSSIAAVGVDLSSPDELLASDKQTRKLAELLLLLTLDNWMPPSGKTQAKLLERFSGPNHFVIYSTHRLRTEEALNRLVNMASASAVVLVETGMESMLTPGLLSRATQLMGRHERLGVLSFGAGFRDGSTVRVETASNFAYVDTVLSGPVVVNRRAFLEVGGLWPQCVKESCLAISYAELSLRMWEGGFSVGLAELPKEAADSNAGQRQLLEAKQIDEAGSSNSALQPHWLKKLAGGGWGGIMTRGNSSEEDPLAKLERLRRAGSRFSNTAPQEASQGAPEESGHKKFKSANKKGAKALSAKKTAERMTSGNEKTLPASQGSQSSDITSIPAQTREPKTNEVEAPVTKVEFSVTDSCATALGNYLAGLRPSSRLAACIEARTQASSDIYADTVDTSDAQLVSRFAAHKAELSASLKSRLMTPDKPIKVCSRVDPEVVQGHRCASERANVALILQYFKRPQNIELLSGGIANTTKGIRTELLINDDSKSDVSHWLKALQDSGYGGPVFISLSNNIHEIRGYNRLSKFSTAHNLAHLQDDDVPNSDTWLNHALILLSNNPNLAVLGGLRGRMDYGTIMDTRYNYINGPKYGVPSKARGCCKKIVHWDRASRIPFMFMYKVNLSPFIIPRHHFMAMGMYHLHFSCAGQPGIGLDFELSVRAWKMGLQVGLYDAKFRLQVGQSRETGTRSNAKLFALRRANELRNNKMLYTMYKGFHHKKGMSIASKALNKLPAPKGWEPMNDAGGNQAFLRQHRGWFMNSKEGRRGGRQGLEDFVRSVSRRAKGT